MRKQSESLSSSRVLQDKVNCIFSSTNVVTGAKPARPPTRSSRESHIWRSVAARATRRCALGLRSRLRVLVCVSVLCADNLLRGRSPNPVAFADGSGRCCAGQALVVVIGTGSKTEFGKIAKSLEDSEEETTPLQKKLDEFGELLGYAEVLPQLAHYGQ